MDDIRFYYFSAKWCGPCTTFKPIIEKLDSLGYPLYIEDVDEDPVLAESYRVKSVPTIKIVSDGKVLETMVGVQDPELLISKFQLYYPIDLEEEDFAQDESIEGEDEEE